jgi:hypothetical protein
MKCRVQPHYLMYTEKEGIGAFAAKKIHKGQIVAIYNGELIPCPGRCRRYSVDPSFGSHFLSVSTYLKGCCSGVINGAIHGPWDLPFYVRNGDGSLLNADSDDPNCCIDFVQLSQRGDVGASYVLPEWEGDEFKYPPDSKQRVIWAFLRAKRNIAKGTQLRWSYSYLPLESGLGKESVELDDQCPSLEQWQSIRSAQMTDGSVNGEAQVPSPTGSFHVNCITFTLITQDTAVI